MPPLLVQHIHFAALPSTNTWAKENISMWARDGITIVSADEQTSGRGRMGRQWISQAGVNLTLTFCYWMEKRAKDVGCASFLLALAAAEVLEKLAFPIAIKWPNDVLINQKKVAGVLTEVVVYGGRLGIVSGIGLNVNMSPSQLEEVGRPATSLLVESGQAYDLATIQKALEEQFKDMLPLFLHKGFAPLFADFEKRLAHRKGDRLSFHEPQGTVEGIFEGIEKDGSLLLRLRDGSLKRCVAGEVLIQTPHKIEGNGRFCTDKDII